VKVVATGATGKFAGLVVPALVSHGIDVRAVVHEPGRKHIPLERGAGETVDADLRDPASLRAALDGADGVFLITAGDVHAGSRRRIRAGAPQRDARDALVEALAVRSVNP
jgi:uncharacterized protein YbjT (DUF2867 family)